MLLIHALSALSIAAAAFQNGQEPISPVTLQDVEVVGRATPDPIKDFVATVAAPIYGRGLARWEMKLCPGVVNLSPDAAQAIVDRITLAAQDVRLETGKPGCDPNLVIIFTDDGPGVAQELAARDQDLFRPNVSGNNRGEAAFRDFLQSDRAVRWWSLSLPTDRDTGLRATRIPGDRSNDNPVAVGRAIGCDNPEDCVISFAPVFVSTSASRLRTQIVDNLYKTIIIVDADELGTVDTNQLGDFLAFVGLAQIDAQAATGPYDTILNLFSGAAPSGLTSWDKSYLAGLYAPRSERRSLGVQAAAIATQIRRDRRMNAATATE